MPIFRITASVDLEVMVYAKDYNEAAAVAHEAMRDHISDDGIDVAGMVYTSHEPVKEVRLLGDWRDSLPYNSDDDKTCRQHLEDEAEAYLRRPPTTEEIEAAGQQRLIA